MQTCIKHLYYRLSLPLSQVKTCHVSGKKHGMPGSRKERGELSCATRVSPANRLLFDYN